MEDLVNCSVKSDLPYSYDSLDYILYNISILFFQQMFMYWSNHLLLCGHIMNVYLLIDNCHPVILKRKYYFTFSLCQNVARLLTVTLHMYRVDQESLRKDVRSMKQRG